MKQAIAKDQSRNQSTAHSLARRINGRNLDVEGYLVEKQNEAVSAMKEAFETVADTQLGLPDLFTAILWSIAKPNLWVPPDEGDWTMK